MRKTAGYIKKSTINFPDIWENGLLKKDKGGRWVVCETTPVWIKDYLDGYRSPSRSWPNSFATALLTQKFARLLSEKDPELAAKLGVAE